jgi:hypothetical protein
MAASISVGSGGKCQNPSEDDTGKSVPCTLGVTVPLQWGLASSSICHIGPILSTTFLLQA